MIEVKMIEDSVNPQGYRLTTLQLRYPRFIHSEFMTHRMFSRNASSSRAIPVERLIEEADKTPATPEFWGGNCPGMQSKKELDGENLKAVKLAWDVARRSAIESATRLFTLGLHKQLANRILEPFTHISVVVSATEWANFFNLRDHPDAEPHIRKLAQEIRGVMYRSTPAVLGEGEWHLPYISQEERENHFLPDLRRCSAARCARVSYLLHDGQKPSMEKDLKLFERLVGSKPIHASPLEHQATPTFGWSVNFCGWTQFRSFFDC